jgi:hypothetical protein
MTNDHNGELVDISHIISLAFKSLIEDREKKNEYPFNLRNNAKWPLFRVGLFFFESYNLRDSLIDWQ